MNQFKKARKNNQQSESAADLKTAGVAVPKDKEPTQDIEASIKKEKTNAVHLDTKSINTAQPAMPDNTQPVIPEENKILSKPDIPTATIEDTTDVITQPPKSEIESESLPIEKSEIIQKPVEYKEVSVSHTANTQPQIIQQPVVQPQYPETNIIYAAEPIETKPVKNSKKSVPNMFTQKNESKSIRKSLVLRPSSVKIAENYCAKNGGSFNELIQILLDNFIEEYGL